jgi:hypothetical protein
LEISFFGVGLFDDLLISLEVGKSSVVFIIVSVVSLELGNEATEELLSLA